MRNNKTIIIENRLAEMFEYLPIMSNAAGVEFKPTFMYGDEKQLNDFLIQNQTGKSMYPLIWLIYPFTESHNVSNVSYKDMQLVLAVETNGSMLNSQRMKETYTKVLFPLLDNIKMLFQGSNIINNSKEYKITKFPNYSEVSLLGEVNKTLYIWDALKVSFDGYITRSCLKPIFFYNKSVPNGNPVMTNPNPVVTNPEPEPNPVVNCQEPVVLPFPNNQFTNSYFVTRGVENLLQIQANNNPTVYSYFVSFLSTLNGISVNAQTGLITINYTGTEETINLVYMAENACGRGDNSTFIRFVDTDVRALLPPINLIATGFNPLGFGPSVMIQAKFLPYMAGTITKIEYWKNNVLFRTLQGSNLSNVLDEKSDLMQLLNYGSSYEFKIRVGNSLGEYSTFSEVLNVTIPQPS